MRRAGVIDKFLGLAGRALATVAAVPQVRERSISDVVSFRAVAGDSPLDAQSRSRSAALMRVNHVGEVCAQALYEGQAFATRNAQLRAGFLAAAAEEGDHLAWTAQRLTELGARPSLLNPLWYVGSFALGALASRSGDGTSLGFMAETERQVERHLDDHIARLPPEDRRSREILEAMKRDEIAHAERARAAGGVELPAVVSGAMRAVSRVMTTTAQVI